MRKVKPKRLKGIQSIVILLLLFFGFGQDLGAQLISRDATNPAIYPSGSSCVACVDDTGCNDTIRLANIVPGGSDWVFNINAPVLTDVVNNVTITISSGTCEHPGILITNGSTTGSITFPGTPDASIIGCDIIFKVEVTKQGSPPNPDQNDCLVYKVRYESQEDPIKIAFVLDISGSMGRPVYSSGSSPPSRIDVLKNAVYSFLRKLEQFSETGADDLVGLTYFTTDVVVSGNADLDNGTVDANASYDPVFIDLDPQTPQSLTALGKGLSKGKQIVGGNTANGYKKVVILITDGLQNVDPRAATIEYDPGLFATFLGDQIDDVRLNDLSATGMSDSVYYYCIAMDVSGLEVPALLSEISQYNGGYAFKTSNNDAPVDNGDGTYTIPNVDLNSSLDQILDQIYNNSPQIIGIHNSKLENGEKTLTFDVNDKITTLLFELNYAFGDNIDIVSIKRNGLETELLPLFDTISTPGANYKIYSVDFPVKEGESEISPKGVWTIKVNGNENNHFQLKGFVDDHDFDYTCSAGKQYYTVGDTIKFYGELTLKNEVIKKPDNKIKVILLKPGDDLGHLLATYETPDLQPDNSGEISPVAMKLNELLKDEAFAKSLAEENQIFELTQDENGQFTGQFSGTELSGVYQAFFIIEANDKYYGNFNRTVLRSVYMRFGMLDPDETEFDVDVSQGDNGQTFVVTVKPKNKFGYYLGPGFSSFLALNLDTLGGVVSEVKDNLDGSYSYTVTNVPENISSDDICITIFGETIGCETGCYPVTIWYYIILLVILLIVILIKKIKAKWFKILMWLILIVWIVYIVLRYLKIICYEFL